MRRLLVASSVLVLATATASGQVIPGEIVPPGTTVATSTDADSARVNIGAIPLARVGAVRFTHVGEVRARNTLLNADALTFTAPLFFGFAGSAALTWTRPDVPTATGQPRVEHVITGELGLAYAIARRMGIGARLRFSVTNGAPASAPLEGALALDAGFAWRIWPAFAVGLTGTNLLGPRVPALGIERTFTAGIGVRPTGTDALTLGLDGSVNIAGTGFARLGARVQIPYVGYVRAEGAIDLPAYTWRAGAGLELAWGVGSAGGGAFFGGRIPGGLAPDSPLGYWATGEVSLGERDRHGIPVPASVVSIPVNGALGARGMTRMILRLERLRRDPAVRGVVFAPRADVEGLANAEELREAFARLRAAGKRVVCHLIEPSGTTYYACAGADTIAMDPAGSLRMAGIRTARFFLGDALRAVGVRTEFVRVGAWKSAPEQFTRGGSSPEARAQEEQLLDDFYDNLARGIAASRPQLGASRVRALIEGGPYTARRAREIGMVDVLAPREAAERAAGRAAGVPVIDLDDYVPLRATRWAPGRTIAVVHIDGDIVDGESMDIPFIGMHMVGDRTIVEVLQSLEHNPRIAAVVLRVDSGGGSSLASEMMWRAVRRLAQHKPVVASFGRIAASGGYYVAAPAREIFADASTLTGSIGIFFGKADIAGLLERVHIGVELSRRGPRADMDSLYRPFTPDERRTVEGLILEGYNLFVARVAAGRRMTPAAVNRVGEGRVFAGTRAQGIDLVNRVGGLAAAIDRARELAGVGEDFEIADLPSEPGGIIEQLARLIVAEPSNTPTARLLSQTEVRHAMSWLVSVAMAGQGHALAMTEWPLLPP